MPLRASWVAFPSYFRLASPNFQPVQTWWIISGCQSCPYTAFWLGQFCFSSWTSLPFEHICGYVTLYICVFGHQIILKSLQYLHTNPEQWHLHLHQQSYHQFLSPQQSTGGSISSIWVALVLLGPSSSSRLPFTTLCKKHCLLRFGSLCFQYK